MQTIVSRHVLTGPPIQRYFFRFTSYKLSDETNAAVYTEYGKVS